jgi:predicted esterase
MAMTFGGQSSFWSRVERNLLDFLGPLRDEMEICATGCARDYLDETADLLEVQGFTEGEVELDVEAYKREWRRELLYGCVYDGLEAVLKTAKAHGKTALCIWFHCLTGRGADFETALKATIADQLPDVAWYFPDAPTQPVAVFNGKMEPSWFDQLNMPVFEDMATPGLEVSVSMVHALLRQAESHGFPSNRILLGGMSQGGVLAMTAGFCYAKPLAGIMSVSAWVPPCVCRAMRQPDTPLMYAIGDQDEVVSSNIFTNGHSKLKQAGCSQVSTRVYPGLDHTWRSFECDQIKEFIQSVASSTPLSTGRSHAAQSR